MIRSSRYYPWPDSSHWSEICAACRPGESEHARAIEALCESFVGPVYSYVRRSGCTEDEARDLTQEFFAHLLGEAQPLAKYDRDRGRFRPFLRAVLANFLKNQARHDLALKRGGGATVLSVDWKELERLCPPSSDATPEAEFDRNYARSVLDRSMAAVRRGFAETSRRDWVGPLMDRLLEGGSAHYEEMATEFGVTAGALRAAATRLRSQLRDAVHREIARTVPSGGDVDEEIRQLRSAFAARPAG